SNKSTCREENESPYKSARLLASCLVYIQTITTTLLSLSLSLQILPSHQTNNKGTSFFGFCPLPTFLSLLSRFWFARTVSIVLEVRSYYELNAECIKWL
ncbi:hypothetical protein F8388_013874, partial [Cannabis sativa]